MGIFDRFQFEPESYGPSAGGLLGLLQSLNDTQSQYQPSAGFGGSPMNANAAMLPAPQATPDQGPVRNMPIGDYQMPQFGTVADYTPQRAPQPVAPPADPSFGDRLMSGFQSWANTPLGNPVLGIANGIQGFSTGQRPANPQDAAREALVGAGVPREVANAAVRSGNDAVIRHVMERFGKPTQYGFQMTPDGTMVRTDPTKGTADPIYQAGTKPTFQVIGKNADGKEVYGYVDAGKRTVQPYTLPGDNEPSKTMAGPDGKILTMPDGADPKTWRNEITRINADVAGGKKTEVQAKSEKLGNKMELAERNISSVEDEGTGVIGRIAEGAPLIGGTAATNWMKSDKYQRYQQARDNFITALLRDESGAAIGTPEFVRYEKELFPQPGDSAGVIAQKREARKVAIDGMRKAAGPGYKSPDLGAHAEKADPLGIR